MQTVIEEVCRTCRSAPAREATEGGSRVCAGCRLVERLCVCPPASRGRLDDYLEAA